MKEQGMQEFMLWMLRYPAGMWVQGMAPYLLWPAGMRKRLKPAWSCSNPWARLLSTREKQATDSTKAANQIALGGVIAGVCEAITYARAAGLDVQTMLDSISQGAAGSWQMNNMAPRMIKEDYDPGFFIKHYIKDMKIALEESDARKLTLPILMEVLDMYKKLDEKGLGDLGTQALIKYYEEQ